MSSHTSPATTPPSSPKAEEYQGAKASVDVPIELMLKQVEAQLERKTESLAKATDLIIQLLKDKKEDDKASHELWIESENQATKLFNERIEKEKLKERIEDLEQACSDMFHGEKTTQKENEKLKAEVEELKLKLEYRTRQYQLKCFTNEELYDEIEGEKKDKYIHKYCDDYRTFQFTGLEWFSRNKTTI